jgi:predicted dinucleotide-binding enzyme
MAKAGDFPAKPVMPVAGDDAARKPTVMQLVGKLGFEPADAGPLRNARLLEPGDEARPRAGVRVRTGRQEVMFPPVLPHAAMFAAAAAGYGRGRCRI